MKIGYVNNKLQRIPVRNNCQGYYLRWYYNGWHYWFFLPGAINIKTEGKKYRTIGSRTVTMSSGQITENQSLAIRTILNTPEVSLYTSAGWANIRIEPGSLNVKGTINNGYEIELTAIIGSRETFFSPLKIVPIVPPTPDPEICQIVIGTQIWMCKNYDAQYPGSRVYNNDEANRAIYGGLYSYDMIKNPGFCPAGWHVPTYAEWNTLIEFIGGQASAAGKLKATGLDYWDSPNEGATDEYDFGARGSGSLVKGPNSEAFGELKTKGGLWLINPNYPTYQWYADITKDSAYLTIAAQSYTQFLAVRLISDELPPHFGDWFLPSRLELKKMYDELHLYGLGGFTPDLSILYMSSTENNATTAIYISFLDGKTYAQTKANIYYTRPCRTFTDEVGAYALRDTGPAGGLIYYIDGTTYYEASPTDIGLFAWSNITSIAVGGTSAEIGTGQANTTAIINQSGHTDSAAKRCNDYIKVIS